MFLSVPSGVRHVAGTTIPFGNIAEPGCYVSHWDGHLLRVLPGGVVAGRSPVLSIVGRRTLYVTKISSDPFLPMTRARSAAANLDLNVEF